MRRRGWRRPAFAILALAAGATASAICPRALAAQQAKPEEAYLTVRYESVLDTLLTALFHRDSLYLPVGGLFSALDIDHAVDARGRAVTGFFLDRDTRYRIDAARGIARVGERRSPLAATHVRTDARDVYLPPSAFERLFGLRAQVDFRTLTVTLTSRDTLPVLARVRRRRRQAAAARAEPRSPAPLRFGRTSAWLDGGVLQYALTASGGDDSALGFDIGAGVELFGGGLSGRFRGRAGTNRLNLDLADAGLRWRYVVDGRRPLVRQVSLGELRSTGLRSEPFIGMRLGNEPVEPRRRLGSRVVDGRTRPGWEVELYVGGELVDHTRADARGDFRFSMPLTYGTSVIELRHYGPNGRTRTERRRIEVPFAFVPAGRMDYHVNIGRSSTTGEPLIETGVARGWTERLTTRVGLEMAGEHRDLQPVASAATSLRLLGDALVALTAAPGALYRAAMDKRFATQAGIGATYTRYDGDTRYNPMGKRDEWRAHGFLPFTLGDAALASLRATGDAVRYRSGLRTARLGAEAVLSLGTLRPSLGYSHTIASGRTLRSEVSLGALAQLPRSPSLPRAARGLFLDAGVVYDRAGPGVSHLRLAAARDVTRYGRVELFVDREVVYDRTRVELRFVLDEPFGRATTRVRRHGSRTELSQELSGTVAYDPRGDAVVFSNRDWLGGAGAALRFFLDADGDGAYDDGERPVDGASVRFRQPVSLRADGPGVIRVHQLLAYARYSAEVDDAAVANPLWTPKFRSFSFVAEPNVYKPIDIPFYTAGVVEGAVTRAATGDGVGGLDVHVRALDAGSFRDTLHTFSDGAFYRMGVPPGRYEVELDPAQLQRLGVAAEPARRTFEVEALAEGDVVADLDFVLLPSVLAGTQDEAGAH